MSAERSRRSGLVDVVVPTYNAREQVERCLAALTDAVVARRIVVDDVSDDGTADAIRRRFGDAEVVELRRHRGLAHALNAGAERGDAPYVLFLNNDVIAEPGAVATLVDAVERDPEGASAGGRLIDPDRGITQDSYRPRDFPGATDLIVRLVGIERLYPANPWTGGHLRRRLDDGAVVRVDQQPAGSCLLVRRAALERVGGWDERFWFWYEDVDLSRRLAEVGPALWVGPAAFRHVGRHSTSRWSKADQHRRLYRGTLRYAERHLGRGGRIAVATTMALVCLPRIAFYWFADRRRAGVYAGLAALAVKLARGEPLPPESFAVPRDAPPPD